MRQVIRRAFAVMLCVAFLVPTVWGRSKDYRKRHPNGDGSGQVESASARTKVLILTWQPTAGFRIPILWLVKSPFPANSRPEIAPTFGAKKKGGR